MAFLLLISDKFSISTLRCLINFRLFSDPPPFPPRAYKGPPPSFINFQGMMEHKIFPCSWMSFFVYVIFFFQFRITWLFCEVLFCNIRKLICLVIYLDLLSLIICLTLFDYCLVLTSFTSCLFIYCKIEHQY